jgi:hypothetical protein
MRDALIEHTGPGRLLDSVMAIEEGDFDPVRATMRAWPAGGSQGRSQLR